MRTLAIGDIHGCSAALEWLLEAVKATSADRLVFLGDYVDRGPDSAGVLDQLIEFSEECPHAIFLRGNHELMMTRARTDRAERSMWQSVGGKQCLASYGPTATLTDVTAAHWYFLDRTCRDYFETDTHLFFHANLDPELPLADQNETMLFWEFLTGPIHHDSGKLAICGHTSQKSGEILDLGDTICIDTFAHGGGWLTCLDVDSMRFWQARQSGETRSDWLEPRPERI